MRNKKIVSPARVKDMSFNEYFELVFDNMRHDWRQMPEYEEPIHKLRFRHHRVRHA